MNRFLLKQFAGNASNNGIFGSAQQGAGVIASSIEQVQSLVAFESGWNSATITSDKLPCLEEFQGLQALLCKAIKEVYSEGIPEWISTETYQLNSHCTYQGDIYHNITGAYTTNNPALDTTNWEKLSDRVKSQITSYFVTLDTAQTISGAKTFSGNNTFSGSNTFSNTIVGTTDGNVDLTTAQTIGGVKTFSSVPSIPTSANTGSSSTDAVNVAYLHNNGYATGEVAMPSGSWIDLTLGISGSSYTATVNGYVVLCKDFSSITSEYVLLYNQANGLRPMQQVTNSTGVISCIMPIKRGQTFTAEYTASGTTNWFRIVKTDGEV